MAGKFIVGVTGVPASGKTTFAKILKREMGDCKVIELNYLVRKYKTFSGKDKWGSYIVKMMALNKAVKEELKQAKERNIILAGHLLPDVDIHVNILVVLREKLSILAERMEKRDYQKEKIAENLSAEITDECSYCENLDYDEVYEVETAPQRRKLAAYIKARSMGKKIRKPKADKIGNKAVELKKMLEKGNKYGL